MRLLATILCAVLLPGAGPAQSPRANGRVPDEQTAVKIAEAALIHVYGKKQIESEQPLKGQLTDGVWTIAGTLHCSDGKGGSTTLCEGGGATVKISSLNGRVLRSEEHTS